MQEYDAVMLEMFELRDALRGARKEVAQSLYMHDAACRTIARLTQEKEAAQKALENLRARMEEFQAQPAPQASTSTAAAEGPEGPPAKRVRPL
jgi:pre-mRNA-processing factor 19